MIQQGIGLIVVSLFILVAILVGTYRFMKAHPTGTLNQSRGWVYAVITFLGLAIIFALLPIDSSAKNSVFSLLGLVVTAVIAISSTTFASNAMAGVMLRIIRNFKAGDFIEVGQHFGRVSETGLLHTEIQTKSRDLTTLPNLLLVTQAVTVIPGDKALVDATLSLGYDVSHHDVERVLKSAAGKIGLTDSFVQVTDLGDFSIGYRVAGFVDNPKLLLSARSNLRKQVIDSLHDNAIEIVSPTFMNQRQYRSDETFISDVSAYQQRQNAKNEQSKVFDKAETAEQIDKLKAQLNVVETTLKSDENKQNHEQLRAQSEALKVKILQLSEHADKQATRDNTTS